MSFPHMNVGLAHYSCEKGHVKISIFHAKISVLKKINLKFYVIYITIRRIETFPHVRKLMNATLL